MSFFILTVFVSEISEMCKEADEPVVEKAPVQIIIPENLPEQSRPMEVPSNAIVPPKHTVEAPNSLGKMNKFEDLPLSDVNESGKAR